MKYVHVKGAIVTDVKFRDLSLDEIDAIEPLWRQLNAHHASHSPYFAEDFRKLSFEERIRRLRAGRDHIRIVAAAAPDGQLIGYAIGSITKTNASRRGELDSMYVETEWRGYGVGKELATRILNWLEENGIANIVIAVATGNEDVLDFYDRLGFAPRAITLRRKPSTQ
jgi:ribosomal protein S18 acetylase RimI-like enzyme